MSNAVRRLWDVLRRPSSKYSLLGLLVVGAIAGVVFWGGFNTVLEATNTMKFCTSCHEMGPVYSEYKETIHYSNRSGVRATCPDCHVPKEWVPKILRKIEATGSCTGKMTGTISTPAKFEANRTRLAQKEWGRMKANDSLACRNCHSTEGMSPEKQSEKAKAAMPRESRRARTCIDCHFGIAHNEPEGPGPQELFANKK